VEEGVKREVERACWGAMVMMLSGVLLYRWTVAPPLPPANTITWATLKKNDFVCASLAVEDVALFCARALPGGGYKRYDFVQPAEIAK
jgi:hypothetical protein